MKTSRSNDQIIINKDLYNIIFDHKNPKLSTIKKILDILNIGILIIDNECKLKFLSEFYEDLLEENMYNIIGQHINDFFRNSRLPVVLETGQAEYGNKYDFDRNRSIIVDRIPIKLDNRIIGACAHCVFTNIDDLITIFNEIEDIQTNLKNYKKNIDHQFKAQHSLQNIIGDSKEISDAKFKSKKFAKKDLPVLILGETGTGKELFAHSIHKLSNRSDNPFICVNCAEIPHDLFESELFGYVQGAFTGANTKGKTGRIEMADGGTLFLDEIGDMPLKVQAKLLRTLEDGKIQKVGDLNQVYVNFRLITATNKNLIEFVKQKKFREDLYYRIETIVLNIPPLRNRLTDIHCICKYFISNSSNRELKIDKHVRNLFINYNWPGNIRELKNVIEYSLCLLEDDQDLITMDCIPLEKFDYNSKELISDTKENNLSLNELISNYERQIILSRLITFNNNKYKVANSLGITRSKLYRLLKKI